MFVEPHTDGGAPRAEKRPDERRWRSDVGDDIADELAPDERVLWYGSSNVEAVRKVTMLVGAIVLAGGIWLIVTSVGTPEFSRPLIGEGAVTILLGLGATYGLHRYLTGYEAAATPRRLIVTNDAPIVGLSQSLAWDEVGRITTRNGLPLVYAGTIVAHSGSTVDGFLAFANGPLFNQSRSGVASIPFFPDPEGNVERLRAIRNDHVDSWRWGEKSNS